MQEIVAIPNKVGSPEIFLTMKCNPLRPMIKIVHLRGQSVVDCPDLAARVLRIKLCTLMAFEIDEKAFGNGKSYVWVIEFQIKGLRLSHCIFFMTPEGKTSFLQPSDIDTIISAENLSVASPVFRRILLKHNMHKF